MPRRDLLFLFALALLFNLSISFFVRAPNYLDDAYYYGGALRLAQGQGFSEPYVWNYLDAPVSLPHPSHLYWMPLTSIVAALPMMILGQSFFAARLLLLFFASCLPLVSYQLTMLTSRSPRYAIIAALITIFSGFYPIFFATTDSFALYALIVALTFISLYRGIESKQNRWWFFAGIGIGLAHLTRADGLLLLIVALVAVLQLHSLRLLVIYYSTLCIGYFIPTSLWFIRNFTISGSPLGSGGMATLWLIGYDDIFNFPSNVSFARYFDSGLAAILRGKMSALTTNVQTVIAVQCLIFLVPFVVVGLWKLRKHTLYRIVILYAAFLYFVMTFAFSFVGARGGLFHSGAALLPFYVAASLAGFDSVIDWIAERRSTWNAGQAKNIFSISFAMLAMLLTLVIATSRLPVWNDPYDQYQTLRLNTSADAVVLSNNPPLVWVAANRSGAMIPNGDETTLLAVADQFKSQYVLIDQNHVSALDRLYQDENGVRLKLVTKWNQYKLFFVNPK